MKNTNAPSVFPLNLLFEKPKEINRFCFFAKIVKSIFMLTLIG